MMRGLLAKTLREMWLTILLFGLGLMLVKALLTYVLPQVQQGISNVMEQLPFVRSVLTAILGTEVGDQITAQTMQAFLWVHPVVLALVWGQEIVLCTRVPAGEIERGTIDILLGFPVSRRAVYLSETTVWLGSGVWIIVMGLIGHRIAAPAMPAEMRPELSRVVLVMANLLCVYVAVGGIAFLVSALSDRRGRAIAIVFGIVLASFFLNFLAQGWEPAEQIAFLSVIKYYQPAKILQGGGLPVGDITTLLAVGAVAWLLGGEVMARRSISTV